MLKTRKNCKKGFSIMELMFAVFVLTIGIMGALGLISSTIRNSMDTRNAAIAAGLAQEGVELVRNIRDNNMLLTLSDISQDREANFMSHGFPSNVEKNYNCGFSFDLDYASLADSYCDADVTEEGAKLYLDSFGRYTHNPSGENPKETIFKRYLNFKYDIDGADDYLNVAPLGLNIVSYVWWGENKPEICNLANKCIKVEDYLPKRD